MVSGLVAFRESMKLFADQAAAGEQPDTPKALWPDYARYDCTSCHHDIRADNGASWRQLRRQGRVPGRPPAPEWPLVLSIWPLTRRARTKTELRNHSSNFISARFSRD